MKKLTLLSLLLLTSVFTLSACVGRTLPETDKAAAKAPTKVRKSAKARSAKADKGNNYGISLSDFSDLNLPNDGETRSNIWAKLADGFQITNPESHPEVQQQIRWFLNHPDYLRRTTERARPYMYIVYNEVKKRGLPTELVLLPINESGYYPFSYSTAGATGIWQLMPGTASNFGLKHDFWYDGRRDIFDSTNAALDYLTYLANYFNNDWLIAIAAYDTGEGNVQNAIARNIRDGLPTDFWSLKLPAETRAYVPRLLAIAAIIEHPDRYPIPLPSIEDKPVVAQVRLPKQMKIADVARLSGLSVNQVKVLNPGLSRFATDPALDAKVMLPIDTIDDFKQGLQTTPIAAPNMNLVRYQVKNGDTLPRLAQRFGISVDEILQANSNLGKRLHVGQELLIPSNSENFQPNPTIDLDKTHLDISSSDMAAATQATPAAPVVKSQPVVKTSSRATKADSPNKPQASANTGTKRPANAGAKASAAVKHKVKAGETLSSIASKNHVDIKQLKRLNPDAAKGVLKPGDVIIISSGA